MDLTFVGQPFPEAEQIGAIIGRALREADRDRAWMATAWGKRSGLSRIANALAEFRGRGGNAEAIIGVDEGGATKEGLELALELFDTAYVFHDPGARTYHPKLYAVQGTDVASVVIGSGNLTRGGLYTNYEASLAGELDLNDKADAGLLGDVRAYYERLLALTDVCKPLTAELIEELLNDPRVEVLSEKRSNQQRAKRRSKEPSGVFGGSAVPGLAGAPPPEIEPVAQEEEDDDDATPAEPPPAGAVPAGAGGAAGAGFFKALSNNDVSLRDSPGQIIIPIGFLPFFGTLTVQKERAADGSGPRQEHREFTVVFRDGAFQKSVTTGRVILYEPASTHKRQNSEVRFTFRDREVLQRLSAGDVLVFGRESGGVVVERHAAGWRPPGIAAGTRYGLL